MTLLGCKYTKFGDDMKPKERDELLVRLDQKVTDVKETLEQHTAQLQSMIPSIASHGTSISWIKKGMGMAATVIGSLFTYLFMK